MNDVFCTFDIMQEKKTISIAYRMQKADKPIASGCLFFHLSAWSDRSLQTAAFSCCSSCHIQQLIALCPLPSAHSQPNPFHCVVVTIVDDLGEKEEEGTQVWLTWEKTGLVGVQRDGYSVSRRERYLHVSKRGLQIATHSPNCSPGQQYEPRSGPCCAI